MNTAFLSVAPLHCLTTWLSTLQGFRMVVVLHEKLGAATFNNDYWKGEAYWDGAKGFYKALG